MKQLRILAVMALMSSFLTAGDMKNWGFSVGWIAEASAADIASSWNRYELNPVLGRGRFGQRQVEIKVGLVGAIILTQWLTSRHHKERYKTWTKTNTYAGAATFGIAGWNVLH